MDKQLKSIYFARADEAKKEYKKNKKESAKLLLEQKE